MARPRPEQARERRREERIEAHEQQRHRRRFLRTLAVVGGTVGAVSLLIALDPPAPGTLVPNLGNAHLASVDAPRSPYNSSPPSSGPHVGGHLPPGELDEPAPPELFVHSLEDGAVVLTYDCPDGCPGLVAELRGVLERNPNRNLILMPYSGIVDLEDRSRRLAAVAWNRVLYFDSVDEPNLSELEVFISLYEGVDHHIASGAPLG